VDVVDDVDVVLVVLVVLLVDELLLEVEELEVVDDVDVVLLVLVVLLVEDVVVVDSVVVVVDVGSVVVVVVPGSGSVVDVVDVEVDEDVEVVLLVDEDDVELVEEVVDDDVVLDVLDEVEVVDEVDVVDDVVVVVATAAQEGPSRHVESRMEPARVATVTPAGTMSVGMLPVRVTVNVPPLVEPAGQVPLHVAVAPGVLKRTPSRQVIESGATGPLPPPPPLKSTTRASSSGQSPSTQCWRFVVWRRQMRYENVVSSAPESYVRPRNWIWKFGELAPSSVAAQVAAVEQVSGRFGVQVWAGAGAGSSANHDAAKRAPTAIRHESVRAARCVTMGELHGSDPRPSREISQDPAVPWRMPGQVAGSLTAPASAPRTGSSPRPRRRRSR
jgi:hypothetical protein